MTIGTGFWPSAWPTARLPCGWPMRGRGVPVQRLERFERPAVGGELAPALERPEPAPERRRAPPIAEQQRDQFVVVRDHGRTPPSAARSFLSAWYTLARAASSLPPSAAAISA